MSKTEAEPLNTIGIEKRDYKKAAVYSIFAYFIMALGFIAWKKVVGHYPMSQILALEGLTSLPLYLLLAKFKGGFHLLKTHYPVLQLCRGILQGFCAYIGLYGLIHLPATTYVMIGYATPFLITLAATLFLKEKCPLSGWISIGFGFLGTAFVIQPEFSFHLFAASCVLLSCSFWAANVILMRGMPKDDVMTFPFYTVIAVGSIGVFLTGFDGITPMLPTDLFLTIIAGLFFFFGAQLLFVTYRLAPLHFTTPFQYTQIIWIGILGYLLWGEIPTFMQIIGLFIIIGATIYSTAQTKDKPENNTETM